MKTFFCGLTNPPPCGCGLIVGPISKYVRFPSIDTNSFPGLAWVIIFGPINEKVEYIFEKLVHRKRN